MSIIIVLTLLLLACNLEISRGQATFSNPILETYSPDPAVLYHGGFYYMSSSSGGDSAITMLKSRTLSNFREAETRVVYNIPPGYFGLWAPEIHFVEGNLYIYFCMDLGGDVSLKRSYVIKADDSENPLGTWDQDAIRYD
jgi:GH43 family beta-xylosidase